MFGKFKGAAVALAAAAALGVSVESADAASKVLGDSGWRVHYGDGLNVKFDGVTSDRAEVKIEKIAQFADKFDRGVGPTLELTFEQISYDAVPFITVDSESIFNQTGSNWSAFNFSLTEATNGSSTSVKFDAYKSFGDDDPFKIDPYKKYSFNADYTELSVYDGEIPDGDVWLPGSGTGAGELVIFGAPVSSGTKTAFFFKEQPVVPLPAAAWTGLAGLAAAGLATRRKAQQS